MFVFGISPGSCKINQHRRAPAYLVLQEGVLGLWRPVGVPDVFLGCFKEATLEYAEAAMGASISTEVGV